MSRSRLGHAPEGLVYNPATTSIMLETTQTSLLYHILPSKDILIDKQW